MAEHSPSGLSALELCPRKYAWDKIDKVPRVPNPYAEFGIKTHKHVEAYYLHGIMPNLAEPEGNAAVALLAHLPPPQPGIRVEEHRICGRFHGYPDLTLGSRVWDHKTCASFNFAHTAESLQHDLQACIYAWFVMQETGALRVSLQWNYVTRERKPRVLPVVRELTFGDLARTLDRAHGLADQADVILRDQTRALSLPPNPHACEMYGGCQHRHRCNLTGSDRLGAYLEKDMTTPQDFLAAMAAPPAPAGASPLPPPVGNPWDSLPADHVTLTMWYNVGAPGGPNWVPKAQAVPPPPPPSAAPAPPAPLQLSIPINPPPAPPSPPTAGQVAAPANSTPNWKPAPEPPAPHPGSPVATDAPVKRRGPGRPRKDAAQVNGVQVAEPGPPGEVRVTLPTINGVMDRWQDAAADALEALADALRRA